MPLTKNEKAAAGVVVGGAIVGGIALAAWELSQNPYSPPPPPPGSQTLKALDILSITPQSPNTTQTIVITAQALDQNGAGFVGATGQVFANFAPIPSVSWTSAANGGFSVTLPAFTTAATYSIELVSSTGISSAAENVVVTSIAPPPPPTPVLASLTATLASGQSANVVEPTSVGTQVTALDSSSHPIATSGNVDLDGTSLSGSTFNTGAITGTDAVSVPINTPGSHNIQFVAINSQGSTITSNAVAITATAASPPPPPPSPPPSPPPPPTGGNSILVASANSTGVTIDGYEVLLLDANGVQLQNGFTPVTFTNLTAGVTYGIEPENFGGETFNHWQDLTASNPEYASNPRPIVAGGAQGYTAVYSP